MIILFALIGALVGGLSAGWIGAIIGVLIGFVGGNFIKQHEYKTRTEDSLAELRKELAEIKARISILTGAPNAIDTAPAAESAKPVLAATALPAESSAQVVARDKEDFVPAKTQTFISAPSIDYEIDLPEKEFWLVQKAKEWLLGGNSLVRAGAILLFIGLAFLLKYAADHAKLPIEFRYLGTSLGALVILVFGWRLRERRPAYAMILQGLAVAILYLITFSAFRLHKLLPGGMTFILLVVLCVLSAALAILQNARALAVTGICGGFLAPVLASTGEGSHVMLFSYYMVLNVGIVGVAWFKAWRSLNGLGFLFTFGIGTLWGIKRYEDEMFASAETFLVMFFILYLLVTLFYARRRKQEISKIGSTSIAGERVDYVDGTLVFGVPLAAFGLQYMMVREMPFGSALSALCMGMIYLPIATFLYRRHQEDFRMIVESFLALGVIFATLAIPFALEAKWTAAAWAVEGAGIFWIGLRQERPVARAFALLVQFGSGVSMLVSFNGDMINAYEGLHASPNAFLMGALFISISGIISAWLVNRYEKNVRRYEKPLEMVVLVWGLLWWWMAGAHEIRRHIAEHSLTALILFAAATAQLLLLAGRYGRWRNATASSSLLLPLLIFFGGLAYLRQTHPFGDYGWIAWPLALASLYIVLHKQEEGPIELLLESGHAVSLLLVTGLASWQLWWVFGKLCVSGSAWPIMGAFIPGLAVLVWLANGSAKQYWPLSRFMHAYRLGSVPIALCLWVWTLFANMTSNGSAAPLPYFPIANPLDIAIAGTLLALLPWMQECVIYFKIKSIQTDAAIPIVLGLTAFYWINGMLLRTISRWADIPLILNVMLRSTLTQAVLSVFWAVLALGLMVWATRRSMRALWLTGGGLMGAVVLKMFIIDLSKIGTVERIITFISVGVLLLLLGYFSPVPPKQGEIK
jgi:uncharacterized membrane protein